MFLATLAVLGYFELLGLFPVFAVLGKFGHFVLFRLFWAILQGVPKKMVHSDFFTPRTL